MVYNAEATVIVEPEQWLLAKRKIGATYGVHTIQPGVHFKLLIAKFSEKLITRPRRMILAHVLPEQAFMKPSAISIEEVLGISSGRGSDSHSIPLEESDESKAQNLVDSMSLDQNPK